MLRSTAALMIRAGFLVVLVPLDVRGFHLVRAREGQGAGADPKVVQRVLGHATASMTMDLYGHMMDANLWQAARLVGDISGTFEPFETALEDGDD